MKPKRHQPHCDHACDEFGELTNCYRAWSCTCDYHEPPLTHEERLKLIEASWPSVTIWCGRTWGGLSKRDTLIPNAGERSWSRSGKSDYETQEDD